MLPAGTKAATAPFLKRRFSGISESLDALPDDFTYDVMLAIPASVHGICLGHGSFLTILQTQSQHRGV